MATAMDVDAEEVEMPTSSSSKGEKKRFEVKKVRKHNLKATMNRVLNLFYILFLVERCCTMGMG